MLFLVSLFAKNDCLQSRSNSAYVHVRPLILTYITVQPVGRVINMTSSWLGLDYGYAVRGFAKLSKFQKSKTNWIELKPVQFFFGNPSVTWLEHSNHNGF